MKARVSTLYRKGKRVPSPRVDALVVGDLSLAMSKHPVTGRACVEACILNELGMSLLWPMTDVQCHLIGSDGMLLRGVESWNGREYAQEWWCVPLDDKAE